MTFQALPGFRDFHPEDLALRSHIIGAWRRVAIRYGFEEYDGPPLEPLELYTAKSGNEIVGQLFEFVDRGGREVALRPEMTPTFARMVSRNANGMRKPIRWFSVPQLFRYERQQRGRLREHFQLNCDLVGESGPLADAEVIALAIDVCRELGLTSDDFKVRLSDRRLLSDLLHAMQVPDGAHAHAYQVLDKIGRPEAEKARQSFLDMGGTASQLELLTGALSNATTWSELLQAASGYPEIGECLAGDPPLREVVRSLDAMGVANFVELDLTIVRGLAYYTGTVFELFDVRRSLRAICGGGRYDNLLQSLGGVDLPALGFGMGDVVLGELLKERGLVPARANSVDCFVTVVSTDDRATALSVAHSLRDSGIGVEFSLNSGTPLGKQLKLADARGARLAVVVGPDDRKNDQVQLKDLRNKTQEAVPLHNLAERCRNLLNTNG